MAGAHCQRWCDADLALNELPSGLVNRVLRPVAQRSHQLIVVVGGKLGADAEQGRNQGGLEHVAPVIVDAVLDPGGAGRVRPRLAIEEDRFASGKNPPVPGKKHAVLPRRYLTVIFPYETGALRDEQDTSGPAVIDVLRHLSGDLSWNI